VGDQAVSRLGSAELINQFYLTKFVVLGDDCEAAPRDGWPWEKEPGHNYDLIEEDDSDSFC
jgi:hypothetical protein